MKPIEKKVVIKAPASEVWKALTEPDKLEKWMLMPNNFKAELNHQFVFNAEMDGKNFDIKCKVLEIEKNKKLVYSWNAPFFDGDTSVSIQLNENNGTTELVLIHSGWSGGQEEPRNNHSKGWDLRFVEKLKEILEKK